MTPEVKPRPIRIILLVVLAGWIAAWNALRLGAGLFFEKTLAEFHASPAYVVTSAAIWMVLGALLAWSIWQAKPWAWLTTCLTVLVYFLWFWVDRLFLQKPQNVNWPFSVAASLIILAVLGGILFSRQTKDYFRKENHER